MKNTQAVIIVAVNILITGAYADVFGTGGNQFSMNFVYIGNAGNAADVTGYGAVSYDYRMGMHEVTVHQFAKAYAADNRIGSGDEDYWNDGTRTVGKDAPASYVSWYEAARFANFLTTGDAYTGAYQFNDSGELTAVDRDSAVSTYGTVFVIPTENEWYKAAYYKPINDGSYSLFANGSDQVDDLTWGTANGWNYYSGDHVNDSPNYMWETEFGAQEQNGTYDMMGNIWEWNESALDGNLNNMAETRVMRGGSATFTGGQNTLRSTYQSYYEAPNSMPNLGFRVAAIPEPSSIAMAGLVSGCAIFIRRIFQN